MHYIFALIAALFITGSINAQGHGNPKSNLDVQPAWGPIGYDHVEYYYLPDIETYYNVYNHQFYYNEGGQWIGRSTLPSRCQNYNLYHSHKVVLNDKEPWENHNYYRNHYVSFIGSQDQKSIRDSNDSRYFENENHPKHNKWIQQQKHLKANK
jgi:hypothetical protein